MMLQRRLNELKEASKTSLETIKEKFEAKEIEKILSLPRSFLVDRFITVCYVHDLPAFTVKRRIQFS